MDITILNAAKGTAMTKTGKPYTFIELAYKGSDGAVKGKKIMPFGESKVVFDALSSAQSGEAYSISMVKNEGTGYWDWTGAVKGVGAGNDAAPVVSAAKPAGKVTGSNYETAEERARRQVYIVRQSSITAALAFLGSKAKTTDDVINTARVFEAYVFDKDVAAAPAAELVSDLPFDNDDIPL